MYRYEVLVFVEKNKNIAINKNGIIKLMESIDGVKVNSNIINFSDVDIQFSIITEDIYNESKCYHDIEFILDYDDDNKIEIFSQFLRYVRQILTSINIDKSLEVLWDDISFYYSYKAYPIIYKLENSMRRLITKFMRIKVDFEWHKNNIPSDLLEKNRKKDQLKVENLLKTFDFINLADLLFDKYAKEDKNELYKEISSLNELNKEKIEYLKSFLPKSNWEKYFGEIIDCNDEELKKIWEYIYDIRCKVAHNNTFTRGEYENFISKSSKISEIIEKANNSLNNITIPEEEIEDIKQNIAIKNNNDDISSTVSNLTIGGISLLLLYGLLRNSKEKKEESNTNICEINCENRDDNLIDETVDALETSNLMESNNTFQVKGSEA